MTDLEPKRSTSDNIFPSIRKPPQKSPLTTIKLETPPGRDSGTFAYPPKADKLYRVGRTRWNFRPKTNFPLVGKVSGLLAFHVFYIQVGSLYFPFLSLGISARINSGVKLRFYAIRSGMKNLTQFPLAPAPLETRRILSQSFNIFARREVTSHEAEKYAKHKNLFLFIYNGSSGNKPKIHSIEN